MKVPISIVHNKPEFSALTFIDWNLGTLCNYACSYCPEALHDGALKWPDASLALRFCEQVLSQYQSLGRRTFFRITGGEPTLYKHLIGLLRRIRELGGNVGINSNGSREIAWWDQAIEYLDLVNLTFHIEFAKMYHFVSVANRLLEHGVRTHVNVTMLPDRFDECAERASALLSQCDGISITLKPLRVNFGELYPYSDEQMKTLHIHQPAHAQGNAFRGDMRCIYDDGTSQLARPTQLILLGQNRWRSWSCNAGIESLAVRPDGEVYRATCREGGSLGNLNDGAFSIPKSPVRCAQDTCNSICNIRISKWQGEGPAPSAP